MGDSPKFEIIQSIFGLSPPCLARESCELSRGRAINLIDLGSAGFELVSFWAELVLLKQSWVPEPCGLQFLRSCIKSFLLFLVSVSPLWKILIFSPWRVGVTGASFLQMKLCFFSSNSSHGVRSKPPVVFSYESFCPR